MTYKETQDVYLSVKKLEEKIFYEYEFLWPILPHNVGKTGQMTFFNTLLLASLVCLYVCNIRF